MGNSFYNWIIDDYTGFRKVVLDEVEDVLVTERERFKSWSGEHKNCIQCNKLLPNTSYFFNIGYNQKPAKKCKECTGSSFRWGTTKRKELVSEERWYCPKCDTILPLNNIYFNNNKHSSTGYTTYCKRCSVHSAEYGINRNLNNLADVKDGFKICLTCLIELPKNQSYYFKWRKDNSRLETSCKKCHGHDYGIKKHNVVYQIEGYYFCHECEEFLPSEKFYHSHGKRRGSYCKKCSVARGTLRERSAAKSGYSITDWKYAKNYWTDDAGVLHCAYCNVDITSNPAMEHIFPHSKGGLYVRENIIPACKSCNSSKNHRSIDHFFAYSQKFTHSMYKKVQDYQDIAKRH